MIVKFKKLSEDAIIPTKAHPSDAGFDMVAVKINETEHYIEYVTNIALELPEGYLALMFPRSSNCKKDLLLANSVGVCDSNYRGSLNFRFKRTSNSNNFYSIGDKIGQIIILPYPLIEFIESNELTETDRGEKGFGSTGR